MKKEFLISKMAIFLFFGVFLFNATAQAQMCFEFSGSGKSSCESENGCYWCPTMGACYPYTTCVTCDRLDEATCGTSPVCHWCNRDSLCHPNEHPCCGNGTLEGDEECEGANGNLPRFCVNCQCSEGTVPDAQNPGYCKPVQVCGNGILEGDEQCEVPQGQEELPRFCVDCKCAPHYSPDPQNQGYCMYAGNNAPVLDPIGNKQAYEEQLLQFTIAASDPDGDGLNYSVSYLPDGATFDPATKKFSWTPGYDQAGNYNVLFTVTDDWTPPASDFEEITITVGNVNRPPILDPIGNKTINEGELLEFTIAASDPDGDELIYSVSNLPDGANFDPATQKFSWIPGYDQAGNYAVTFTVTDKGTPPESDSKGITLTVGNVNRPPILNPIGNKRVNEGELLEFSITASDPDGDGLNYLVSNLPDGANFDPATQKFSWIPGYDQAGSYQVTFNVSDGELSTSETITITVNDVVLQATIDINPKTLNLKSKGGENSMTVYIELPGGYDVRQIRVSSIRLNVNGKIIPAQSAPTSIGDYDGDGIKDLMVKFDRQAVISALGSRTGNISLTVTGTLNNGVEFTGSDTIRVINPGK